MSELQDSEKNVRAPRFRKNIRAPRFRKNVRAQRFRKNVRATRFRRKNVTSPKGLNVKCVWARWGYLPGWGLEEEHPSLWTLPHTPALSCQICGFDKKLYTESSWQDIGYLSGCTVFHPLAAPCAWKSQNCLLLPFSL